MPAGLLARATSPCYYEAKRDAMRKLWAFCTAVVMACSAAVAVDVSGEWKSGVTLAAGAVSVASRFTLDLAGPGWRLTSSWDPAFSDMTRHSLVLRSSLGPLDVTAGATFHLSSRTALARTSRASDPLLWSADGFSFGGGFVSFELALGSLTLRLTLASDAAE